MSHAATRAALAARRASIVKDSAAVAELRLDSWAYASVARDYLDRAWMLTDQDLARRALGPSRRVRSHLSPHRGEMVGLNSEALAALDDLGRVLDGVEVTP
jgi:hypothetical protein